MSNHLSLEKCFAVTNFDDNADPSNPKIITIFPVQDEKTKAKFLKEKDKYNLFEVYRVKEGNLKGCCIKIMARETGETRHEMDLLVMNDPALPSWNDWCDENQLHITMHDKYPSETEIDIDDFENLTIQEMLLLITRNQVQRFLNGIPDPTELNVPLGVYNRDVVIVYYHCSETYSPRTIAENIFRVYCNDPQIVEEFLRQFDGHVEKTQKSFNESLEAETTHKKSNQMGED